VADPVMPVEWARDHGKSEDRFDFTPQLGWRTPHYIAFAEPITCPACDGLSRRECRGHYHACDDCRGTGVVAFAAGQREDCPLCWDDRLDDLTRGLVRAVEAHDLAQRQAAALSAWEG